VHGEQDVIVAIEGSNGLSQPVEKLLRTAGVIFYSFKPADTDKFRKAAMGQNKNNERDAESVARFAMALESQGRLELYRRVWFPNVELQLLTRSYERSSAALTAATNRLWKLLRQSSPDLYMAFGGKNPEVDLKEYMLTGQGVLSLLAAKPDISEWHRLSTTQLAEAMGVCNYPGRAALIENLQKAVQELKTVSPTLRLLIGNEAHHMLQLREQENSMSRLLAELIKDSGAAQALLTKRGIGTITAATMIAEIIDIRRFAREDSLACYSGLGLKQHSTGETNRMIHTPFFNHRLKDAFMTAARNFVRFNPDSHLSGYYRNLVKNGMSSLEATKRVARALVRVVFKVLNTVVESQVARTEAGPQIRARGESDVANGNRRSEGYHLSNTSPSSPPNNTTRRARTSKRAEMKIKHNSQTKKSRTIKNSA
jgi:transposase